MKTNKNEHGDYELWLDEEHPNIIRLRAWGPWNLETAQHCTDDMWKYADSLKEHPWAFMEDIREWELCTPEVSDLFIKCISKMVTMNFKVRVVVASVEVQRFMIQKSIPDHQPVNTRFFTDLEGTVDWCCAELEKSAQGQK